MSLHTIVVDNTVLNYFIKIKTVNLERICRSIITGKILVPSQIVPEILPIKDSSIKNQLIIDRWLDSANRHSFFSYCDSYDTLVYDIVRKKINDGEAGAIAQCIRRQIPWFISDDYKNTIYIKQNYPNIRLHTTYFLIALADIQGYIPDYPQLLNEIFVLLDIKSFTDSKRKNHQKIIREDYTNALKHLGINFTMNKLIEKTRINNFVA